MATVGLADVRLKQANAAGPAGLGLQERDLRLKQRAEFPIAAYCTGEDTPWLTPTPETIRPAVSAIPVQDEDPTIHGRAVSRSHVADGGRDVGIGHVAPRVVVPVHQEQSHMLRRGSSQWLEVHGIAGQHDPRLPLRERPHLCVAGPGLRVDDFVPACQEAAP
ncbi:MAG TPA: hypothetical protein VFK38_00595 [Candidatus Limnocylindrales bacterium]|nr:hypothetical protein [Candidatus Limnocylindrales bacterium]